MWGDRLKYVPHIGVTGHVISRMRSDDLHWTGTLESNISKKAGDRGLVTMEHAGDRGLVTMEHEQEKGYGDSNGYVTDDVT